MVSRKLAVVALLALPVFAQDKPDTVTISREVVLSTGKACAELIEAMRAGKLYIKELEAENAQLRALVDAQGKQIALLTEANGKLELALKAQVEATESYKKAVALSDARAELAEKRVIELETRKGKKGKVVAVLRIGAVIGGGVLCGIPCAAAAGVIPDVVTILRKGKKGQ